MAIKVSDPRPGRRWRSRRAVPSGATPGAYGWRTPTWSRLMTPGRLTGVPYLVLEFVEGHDLAWIVQQRGPLPAAEACEVVRRAALGLEHLHKHGLVHRDVKPANLMLTPSGQVKVLDLGVARRLHVPAPEGTDHVARPVPGHPRLHGPRAVPGQSRRRWPRRHLRAGLHAVRAVDRPAAVRGPRPRVRVPEDEGPRRGACAANPGAPPRCPGAAGRGPGADAGQGPRGPFRQRCRRCRGPATLCGRCRFGRSVAGAPASAIVAA